MSRIYVVVREGIRERAFRECVRDMSRDKAR